MGKGVKAFKDGVKDETEEAKKLAQELNEATQANVTDASVTDANVTDAEEINRS